MREKRAGTASKSVLFELELLMQKSVDQSMWIKYLKLTHNCSITYWYLSKIQQFIWKCTDNRKDAKTHFIRKNVIRLTVAPFVMNIVKEKTQIAGNNPEIWWGAIHWLATIRSIYMEFARFARFKCNWRKMICIAYK